MSKGLPYNGWLEPVRHGRDKHYYHARSNGVLRAASACDACGVSFGDRPVPYHAEEYGPTLEDYWASCVPLCHRCHAMVHARFDTPNLWKQFITQLAEHALDEQIYPQSTQVVALLSKFKRRSDIGFVPAPSDGNEYLRALPLETYSGPTKVAILLVLDERSGQQVEVPDWTIYGEELERLSDAGRETLKERGVQIEEFVSGRIGLPRLPSGERKYVRLYLPQPLHRRPP